MLTQFQGEKSVEKNADDIENSTETITRTFVPLYPLTQQEDVIINKILEWIKGNNPSLIWPEIEGILINEFQTADYIIKAFLTLYPYGQADLRSACIKEIKPAKYFKYLLWYKNGRFTQHLR